MVLVCVVNLAAVVELAVVELAGVELDGLAGGVKLGGLLELTCVVDLAPLHFSNCV